MTRTEIFDAELARSVITEKYLKTAVLSKITYPFVADDSAIYFSIELYPNEGSAHYSSEVIVPWSEFYGSISDSTTGGYKSIDELYSQMEKYLETVDGRNMLREWKEKIDMDIGKVQTEFGPHAEIEVFL